MAIEEGGPPMAKRLFDLLLALIGLALFWPLLLLIALLIKLDSHGSVFFHQERIGKDGQPFQILKFLKGDMSFIGPRPEDPYFVSLYTEEERVVLSVRPGIVGPSQIIGRDELELFPEGVDTEQYYMTRILPEKLQRDLQYVQCEIG